MVTDLPAGIPSPTNGGVRVTILGSGSQGNATLFEAPDGTRVLVDAGLSLRKIRARYRAARGQSLERVDALVLTHAHGDHVGHAARVAKGLETTVHLTRATAKRVDLEGAPSRPLDPRGTVRVGGMRVHCQPVPHDEPQVALVVEDDGGDQVGLVTDLGRVPRGLERHLRGCRTVLLESNHEPELLATADYPRFLRDRIASPHGHLSNAAAARLLRRLARHRLERVMLMHLSQKANSPQRALARAEAALAGEDVEIRIAHQDRVQTYDEPRGIQLGLSF